MKLSDLPCATKSTDLDRLRLSFATSGDAESTLVVSGAVNAAGNLLKAYGSGNFPFYLRTPNATHSTGGDGMAQRVATGAHYIGTGLGECRMVRVSEEAYFAGGAFVAVGAKEIDVLKAELPNTKRTRIRLCTHRNVNDALHEMFVLYTKETYIQPNKHLGKDETFHILEGEADFIFYSDSGDVLEIIPLGTKDSGRDFFVRVPQGVYHSVVMTSDYLVIHEATPGPYIREHTVWAPWAKSQGSGRAY